jgi:hypothetical protein
MPQDLFVAGFVFCQLKTEGEFVSVLIEPFIPNEEAPKL